MDSLSANARRILDYLYDEKDPRARTADVICEALGLSEDEWEIALGELFQNQVASVQGKRSFKPTTSGVELVLQARRPVKADIIVEGNVGPGAVVGPGQIQAAEIAGGDIVSERGGSEERDADELASAEPQIDTWSAKDGQIMEDFMTRAILTLDIADFSLMEAPTEQMQAIRALIALLHEAVPANHNQPMARIWSPAGDGGALTFMDSIHAALDTAIALSKALNSYNTRPGVKPFQLRMGLHTGAVTREKDFDDRENVWGEGMNTCARITGLAKPGQILASEEFYRHAQLHIPKPGREVTCIGKWWVKHEKSILVYNVHTTDGAGLPPSEVEEWHGPFHYPLAQAIRTYEAMVREESRTGHAFRAAVVAKRLLDLAPGHEQARSVIESISRQRFPKTPGGLPPLYDVFFSELSPSALIYFFENAVFRSFERDDVIVREGEIADSLMMVVSGEIIPLIGDKRLRERDPDRPEQERQIVLREGHITGEMGLFNPGGRRTATLQASKNTITLSLGYPSLQVDENATPADSLVLADFTSRVEIRRRIWQYYRERTIENQIYTHPLFQELSSAERNKLNDTARFLPTVHGQPIQMNVEDVWYHWLIVVAGHITLHTAAGDSIQYGPSDCIGPIRLVVSDATPFSSVEIAPDTHLVSFPWRGTIQKLIQSSPDFRNACLIAGGGDKARLGLI